MVDIGKLKQELFGLVGFNEDMSLPTGNLSQALMESRSGAYFQEAHPLITIQLLKEIAPKAIADTVDFNTWLTNKVNATIIKVVQTIIANNIVNNRATDVLANSPLFSGVGFIKNTVPNLSNFVGLEIAPKNLGGVALKLNRIGLQATSPAEVSIEIYHSSQIDPIKIIPVNKTIPNSFEWFDVTGVVLDEHDYDLGGYWLIGYNQDNLQTFSSEAINKNELLADLCNTCKGTSGIRALKPFIDVSAFTVSGADKPANQLWDQALTVYVANNNFGLNIDLSVVCDYTSIFIRNQSNLVPLIKMQFAVDMLREYIYNPNARANRTAAIASRADILYAVDGDNSKFARRDGLAYNLEKMYKAFELNMQGVNNRCIPCRKAGITYRTIG